MKPKPLEIESGILEIEVDDDVDILEQPKSSTINVDITLGSLDRLRAAALWRDALCVHSARSRHFRTSPTADILSGLSLHMRTDSLDEPTMNQAVMTQQHVLRILIIQTGGSGE